MEGFFLYNSITVTRDKVQGRQKVYSKRDINNEKKRLIKHKENKN